MIATVMDLSIAFGVFTAAANHAERVDRPRLTEIVT
jgi:hypothetical protein